jgi:hypothetical protein
MALCLWSALCAVLRSSVLLLIEDPLRRSLVFVLPVISIGALCVEDKRTPAAKLQVPDRRLSFLLFIVLIQGAMAVEALLALWIAGVPL